MAFPLDYPSGVGLFPAKVKVRRLRAQAAYLNEITLTTKAQLFGNMKYAIDVQLQVLDRTDAATFDSWLEELNGLEGTFRFDLDPHVRGALPGVRTFKLLTPNDEWDSDLACTFGYAFSAQEV